jgi:peptidoglycan/LPS O-acetylase OafA/YrhL
MVGEGGNLARAGRLRALDGVRGLAALVVVLFHFGQHYDAELHDRVFSATGLELFNGPASVVTFFVLSGFVLYVAVTKNLSVSHLCAALTRRWPRLAGPVLMAALMMSVGALIGAYPSPSTVSQETINSNYFVLYGFTRQANNFGGLAYEAAFGAFAGQLPWYNPVLWSMHFEILGSFIVFSVAAAALIRAHIVRFVLISSACAISVWYSYWLLPFILGIALASLRKHFDSRTLSIPNLIAAPAVMASLIVFTIGGPHISLGLFSAFGEITIQYLWVTMQTVASIIFIVAALWNASCRNFLQGWVCQTLVKCHSPHI